MCLCGFSCLYWAHRIRCFLYQSPPTVLSVFFCSHGTGIQGHACPWKITAQCFYCIPMTRGQYLQHKARQRAPSQVMSQGSWGFTASRTNTVPPASRLSPLEEKDSSYAVTSVGHTRTSTVTELSHSLQRRLWTWAVHIFNRMSRCHTCCIFILQYIFLKKQPDSLKLFKRIFIGRTTKMYSTKLTVSHSICSELTPPKKYYNSRCLFVRFYIQKALLLIK